MSAKHITLGELMLPKTGSIDPSKFPDELFSLYSIPAYENRQPDVVTGNLVRSVKQIAIPGDVLLSKIIPHLRRSWVVDNNNNGRRIIASGEWVIFRNPLIHPAYLRHVFISNSFHSKFMKTVSGVGGSLLRARPANLAAIEILLPPLSEQRRIAAVLDQADALRVKRHQALARLDELTQSIFFNFYREAKEVSLSLPLINTVEATRGSFVNGPFGSDLLTSELQETGTPVIYIRDIRNTEYRRVSAACVSEEKARTLAVCSVNPGDVLVAKVGDPPGIAAIYPQDEKTGVVTQDVIRLRLDTSRALPEFIVHFLNSPTGRHRINEITVSATRARFSLRDFKMLTIELPPLKFQRAFARRVKAIERLKSTHHADLAELDALFASLQYRAFRGEL